MPTEVTRWRCDFCKKNFRVKKSSVLWHEERCWHNPASRSCVTCVHLLRDEIGERFCDVLVNIDRRLMTKCSKYKRKENSASEK